MKAPDMQGAQPVIATDFQRKGAVNAKLDDFIMLKIVLSQKSFRLTKPWRMKNGRVEFASAHRIAFTISRKSPQ